MDEYIPQLTLTPDLSAQAQPEVKKEEDLITKAQAAPEAGPDLSALSPAEQQAVLSFAKQIDLENAQQVLEYGASAQKNIADFSDTALAKVKTGDLGEIGTMLSGLLVELKTLEEPPEGVMFILLGTSADVMLPTIVSRCQCVPFRLVSPAVAAQAVSRATGQDPARCRMAVAVAGSPTRGIEFLKSAERQDARRQMVRAIDSLIAADEADVLSRAKSLIVAVKAPLAEVKSTQEKVLEQNADYLSRGALKQLEDRNKRELNARERSGIMEALASARTLMRDVLLTLQDEAADVVNEDVRDTIGRLAAATNVAGATQALEAVATAERNIARNVTPQLAIEVMLFDIRKALKCR